MNTELKPGDRIRLIEMPNDPCPIEAGTEGLVTYIGPEMAMGYERHQVVQQVYVTWDTKRSLILLNGVDQFEVIS